MSQPPQFRRALPVLQTSIAILFGGWGLWIRNSVLSRPFWGSDGWHSTARFHVWPWPFKFAAILNLPALLAGALLSWPLDYLRAGLPEWVANIPALVLIPLFWYWLGSWADGQAVTGNNGSSSPWQWILLLLFIFVCAAASSMSSYVGGYASYLEFGIAIWVLVAVGLTVLTVSRKHKSRIA